MPWQPAHPTSSHPDAARMPNPAVQFLLADSVSLILAELAALHAPAVDCVSLDTKHILAWVKENNPKAYVQDRLQQKQAPRQ